MTKSSLRYPAILGLTLGLGIVLSVGAAWFVGQWESARRQTQFQQQIENLSTALQRSLNRYTDVLTFLHDYYQVAEQPVSRQSFAEFVARSLSTYPGIPALEWAPLVRAGDRAAFEASTQAEGYPAFAITELSPRGQLQRAGARAEYVPVTYVAPFLKTRQPWATTWPPTLPRHRAAAAGVNQGRPDNAPRMGAALPCSPMAQSLHSPIPQPPAPPSDQRVIHYGRSWEQFKSIQTGFDQAPGVRLFYYGGMVEVLMPGREHERLHLDG